MFINNLIYRSTNSLLVIKILIFFISSDVLAQDQIILKFQPFEDSISYTFPANGFERDQCTLEILRQPSNADTAFISKDTVTNEPILQYIQGQHLYRKDTLLLARQCQSKSNELVDTLEVIFLIAHPVGQTFYIDTTINNQDTLELYFDIYVSHCSMHVLREPNHAALSNLEHEIDLFDDTATYTYVPKKSWIGNDTVLLIYSCSLKPAERIDTLVLIINTKRNTTSQKYELTESVIYPNPANDFIYVYFNDGYRPNKCEIELLSLNGIVLRKSNKDNYISANGLHPGLYLIKLNFDNYTVTRKIMIK